MIWPTFSRAVLLPHVLDDLAAAPLAEVDVDVGHRDAVGVQEALEEEVVAQRVDVRDPERPGDERAGGASRGPGPTGIPSSLAYLMKSQTMRK